MRILSVMPYLPYPPDDGGRIVCFEWLKEVSQRHDVWLCAFVRNEKEIQAARQLHSYCRGIEYVRLGDMRRRFRIAWNLLSGMPPTVAQYYSAAMARRIRATVASQRIDLIQCEHLHMAPYLAEAKNRPALLILHNVSAVLWSRYAQAIHLVQRAAAQWMRRSMERFERRVLAQAPHCFALTKHDAGQLMSLVPEAKVGVFPVALDGAYFSVAPSDLEEPYSLLFTGSFLWPPKVHNVLVLIKEIFPLIKRACPRAKLYIVGKGATSDMRAAAAELSGVIIVGAVADPQPYLVRASVVLQYAQIGSGIPLKLLEAMAMGKAIVSNSVGCEGVEAQPGADLLVADEPADYAEMATELLRDSRRRKTLSENARLRAEENYSWRKVTPKLESLYEAILRGTG